MLAPPHEGPLAPRHEPPTFSVVIPVYQGADTIGEAIASVLAQTVPPHEIIVADDGSTDDLAGALAPYRDRITLLTDENRGVAAARNRGVRRASGEFVVVSDADDLMLPRAIDALGDFAMARPDLDILVRTAWVQRGDVRILSRTADRPHFPVDDQRIGILRDNFIPGHAAFRRQRLLAAGGYDESLRCGEDYDSWIRLIFAGSRAGLLLEPLQLMRPRPGSLSTRRTVCIAACITSISKLAGRDDLSEREREIAAERVKSLQSWLREEEAKLALVEGAPDARRRCLSVARDANQNPRARSKALLALLAPKSAARLLGDAPYERI